MFDVNSHLQVCLRKAVSARLLRLVQNSSLNSSVISVQGQRVFLILGLVLALILPPRVVADGCFVFVWNKAKDINEPTQKAIIVHEAGRGDLILQVKYEGPVEEFGWLIPVPGLPTVKKGSMECFYELSRYTQEHFDPRYEKTRSTAGINGEKKPEPIKVIEVKTVGAYEVTVLSAKSAGSLENWLNENHFSFPQDKADVIDSYVKQQWYWVAAKIHLGRNDSFKLVTDASRSGKASDTNSTPAKLARGELHPLHISFDSAKCVFPLKISSVNGAPSEVQVYVLSREPLLERGMLEMKLPEVQRQHAESEIRVKELMASMGNRPSTLRMQRDGITNTRPLMPEEDDSKLGRKSEVNRSELLPFGKVTQKEIPECSKQISSLKGKSWWLTKQTWTFQPETMRDLYFEPALPVFVEKLAGEDGYFAAANLLRLGSIGTSALLEALQSTKPTVRAHGAFTAQEMRDQRLATLLPGMFKDTEPEVRLYAAYGSADHWDAKSAELLVGLLSDENREINRAALYVLRQAHVQHPKDVSKQTPVLLKLLKDGNPGARAGAFQILRLLQVSLPRDDVLALFKTPRMDGISMASAYFKDQGISSDEAAPLLQNPVPLARLIGLKILRQNADNRAVELLIPLLKDREQLVQVRAYRLLCQLTGQDIPLDQPDKWEQWWTKNKATFTPKPPPPETQRMGRERLPRPESQSR